MHLFLFIHTGRIEVHNPHRLETDVLNRYFRHSKFASFQRQLNYFGFRKLAGKGKMAPCSYVNDSTTSELTSILHVKVRCCFEFFSSSSLQSNTIDTALRVTISYIVRNTSPRLHLQRKIGNEPRARGGKKRERDEQGRVLAGQKSGSQEAYSVGTTAASSSTPHSAAYAVSANNTNHVVDQSQKALARVAVGRGVRHGFVPQQNRIAASSNINANVSKSPSLVAPSPVQASLNALTSNYRNSLNELQSATDQDVTNYSSSNTQNAGLTAVSGQQYAPNHGNSASTSSSTNLGFIPGSLRRDDSLVDLAMIPLADDGEGLSSAAASTGFSFVDFPFDPNFLSGDDFNQDNNG